MRKLLKHEFIAAGQSLLFIYLGCLFAGGLYLLANLLQIGWFRATATVLLFAAMAAAVIITFVQIVQRFFRSMFGAEGYLTLTLPLSSRKILLSKLLVSYVWLVLSYALAVGMVLLFFFVQYRNSDAIAKGIDMLLEFYRMYPEFFIGMGIVFLVMVLVQQLFFVISLMFCISLAHLPIFTQNHGAIAFVAYLVFYSITNVIEVVILFFLPLSVKFEDGGIRLAAKAMDLMQKNFSVETMSLGLGSLVFELILSVALFFVTAWLIRSKTSVRN